MRGRKPLPTKLKILRGNLGKRPLNEREPQPRADLPECPPHLDAEAKAEWGRIAPELHTAGILTIVDRAALAAYCQCWSRWVKMERKVQEFGEVLMEKKTNSFYRNPYLFALNRTLQELRAFLVEFGMTPSSRTRLTSVEGRNANGDDKSRFFRRA